MDTYWAELLVDQRAENLDRRTVDSMGPQKVVQKVEPRESHLVEMMAEMMAD